MRYENCNNGEQHIYCWDGRNHNARRQDIYPAYKANRVPMGEDRFAQIGLFREALSHSCAAQIECDGWEADDVIGALVHRFATKHVPVTVYTNDLDYWQLMVYKNVTINGIQMKSVPDCEPHHIPIYKALVGDSSDNIIGIHGFGKKSWNALTLPQRKMLQRAIENDDVSIIIGMPLPTRVMNLLMDPANRAAARAALAVTRFIPVPDNELNAGIKPGTLNREAANQLFKRYFL